MQYENMPPELQSYVQGKMMEQEAKVMSIDSLIEGLDLETGLALADLLSTIGESASPAAAVAYFEGMIRGRLSGKFDVCALHGVNHEAEQMNALKDSMFPGGSTEDLSEEMKREEAAIAIESDLDLYNVGFTRLITDDNTDSLEELRSTEAVTCMACGYRYPSLEDRMLKPPTECPGCQIKSAHG